MKDLCHNAQLTTVSVDYRAADKIVVEIGSFRQGYSLFSRDLDPAPHIRFSGTYSVYSFEFENYTPFVLPCAFDGQH